MGNTKVPCENDKMSVEKTSSLLPADILGDQRLVAKLHSSGAGYKKPHSKSTHAIKTAEQFIHKVLLKGGDVTQARWQIQAAKARASEDAEVLAMAAARRAITLAKTELSKQSDEPLRREGTAAASDVGISLGTYSEQDTKTRDFGSM